MLVNVDKINATGEPRTITVSIVHMWVPVSKGAPRRAVVSTSDDTVLREFVSTMPAYLGITPRYTVNDTDTATEAIAHELLTYMLKGIFDPKMDLADLTITFDMTTRKWSDIKPIRSTRSTMSMWFIENVAAYLKIRNPHQVPTETLLAMLEEQANRYSQKGCWKGKDPFFRLTLGELNTVDILTGNTRLPYPIYRTLLKWRNYYHKHMLEINLGLLIILPVFIFNFLKYLCGC